MLFLLASGKLQGRTLSMCVSEMTINYEKTEAQRSGRVREWTGAERNK